MEEADQLVEPSSTDSQTMFEQRFDALMNGFGKACEENGVSVSLAIAVHPEEDMPLVFIRGEEYEVARVVAAVYRQLKNQIMQELDV